MARAAEEGTETQIYPCSMAGIFRSVMLPEGLYAEQLGLKRSDSAVVVAAGAFG
jgi:hypothetical protein